MFGLPLETSWMLLWPIINLAAAVIVFFVMKKQDEMVDDSEYGDEDDIQKYGLPKEKEVSEA